MLARTQEVKVLTFPHLQRMIVPLGNAASNRPIPAVPIMSLREHNCASFEIDGLRRKALPTDVAIHEEASHEF